MGALGWILLTGLLMCAIALVGSITLIHSEKTPHNIHRVVAFTAGNFLYISALQI